MQQFFQRKEHKVDLDKRHDPAHEYEKAWVAVQNRHRFETGAEVKAEPAEGMWEHLKRLGLEQYACAFESYGFFSKNSCVAGGALPVAEIDKWCKDASLEFSFDRNAQNMIKQWLDPSHPQRATFDEDYALVSKHKIMSMLQAAFPKEIPAQKDVSEMLSETESGPHSPRPGPCEEEESHEMVRSDSRKLDRWAEHAQEAVHQLMYTDTDGKSVGKVSILELKRHLSYYSLSLSEAVRKLRSLMQRRPAGDVLRPMAMRSFLSRFGCKAAIHALEDVGLKKMQDLTSSRGETKIDQAEIGPNDKATIKAYLKPDGLSARQLDDFNVPDDSRIMSLLKCHYGLRTLDASAWVTALTSKGPVSVLQLREHMEKYGEAADGLTNLDEIYALPEKEEREVPPPPEGWIVDWLKDDEELADYASNFQDQKISTKEDLLSDPPLDCQVLKDVLGIDKLGHQKKILVKIAKLRQE